MRFEEKILYKCRQYWIVPVLKSLKMVCFLAFPLALGTYFLSWFSWGWTISIWILISLAIIAYDHYLWYHSWLMIGNQKITLSVRNGIFSQYAMSIRYRNIRDSAVSKNNIVGYLLKYGTLFIRASSGSEGDFQARYVPKVGKVYALINALSRYNDDERAHIDTIEKLHAYHTRQEFTPRSDAHSMDIETAIETLKMLPWVVDVVPVSQDAREYIRIHEASENSGITEALDRKHLLCLLHDQDFRKPAGPIVHTTHSGKVEFPWVPFPEIQGKWVVSASPSIDIHRYLLQYFPYASHDDATVLIGWIT